MNERRCYGDDMVNIPRATTPTLILTFGEQIDLTDALNVYVTLCHGVRKITKQGASLEVTQDTISVYLSQAETLSLGEGEVEVQANWTYTGGDRAASNIARIELTKQLLDKVVD